MTEKIFKEKKKKESPIERGRGKSCQGFWRKNTTRRVEIFSTKPVGLDLYSWWRLVKEAPYLRCPFLIFLVGICLRHWLWDAEVLGNM